MFTPCTTLTYITLSPTASRLTSNRYFSAQSNKVVPRARASPRPRSASAPSSRTYSARQTFSCNGRSGEPTAAGGASSNGGNNRCDNKDNGGSESGFAGETRRRRHHWNPSTEGAENAYRRTPKPGLPDFL